MYFKSIFLADQTEASAFLGGANIFLRKLAKEYTLIAPEWILLSNKGLRILAEGLNIDINPGKEISIH